MNEIDDTLKQRYGRRRYGELSAIYELAHLSVLQAIETVLSRGLRTEKHFSQTVYVDCQWIDKIPLAKFIDEQVDLKGNKISGKTEIGDIFIQYRKCSPYLNGGNLVVNMFNHRSLVIQAKISTVPDSIVPIGKINKKRANSTSKELKLLQDWPPFDLYETSRSGNPLAKDIKVDKKGTQFAFYGGFYNGDRKWTFGHATNNTPCTRSYGSLIVDLANGTLGKDSGGSDGWGRLCGEISKVCQNRLIPSAVSNGIESRSKRATAKLYCFPACLLDMIREMFRKRGMLVILIDQVDYEGRDIIDEYLNPIKRVSTRRQE